MIVCRNSFSRLRGAIFRSDISSGLLLVPCCQVHTFFLFRPIDAAYLDSSGRVLFLATLQPFSVGPRVREAAAVLEYPAGKCPFKKGGVVPERIARAVVNAKKGREVRPMMFFLDYCKKKLAQLVFRQDGQAMTEYGLILALVAVATIAAVVAMRGELLNTFTAIRDGLRAR